MTRIREALEKRDEGFTLIELLVVVIIIGILAAIAIPVFLNQRERAWAGTVESDLRNAAIQMETYFTQNDTYPLDAAAQPEFTDAQLPSDGVTLQVVDADTDGTKFCVEGEHANLTGTIFSYDSNVGGLQAEGTECAGGTAGALG